MKRLGITVIMGIILLCLGLAACGGEKDETDNQTQNVAATTQFDAKAVLKETDEFKKGFSQAISDGKTETVLDMVEASARLQLTDLDLSSPEAKQLATAISNAKDTEILPTMVYYGSKLGDESISFYIIKEDGKWKFGGF